MEVLALVALHQPTTRGEVEQLRGASIGQATIDLLLEAGLIMPADRKEAPGRPTMWATTPQFLAQFGLRSLRDLPGAGLLAPAAVGGGAGAPRPSRTWRERHQGAWRRGRGGRRP